MKKYILLALIAVSALWLVLTEQTTKVSQPAVEADKGRPEPRRPQLQRSLNEYLSELVANGYSPALQAVLIETLDGQALAEYNADTPLNPASVMKLATSYLALQRYSPDYRFKTLAYTTGIIDPAAKTLYGDIVIEAEADPHFTVKEAEELAAAIRKQQIKRVVGNLIFKGHLRFYRRWSTEYAQAKMKKILALTIEADINPKQTQERTLLAVHYSKPLKELLLYMNAHSDNFYADQLGEALGGPEAMKRHLQQEFKLASHEIEISAASGLDYNRITARASLAIQRKLIMVLAKHGMKIEDIMPVAGVDSGTLVTRFRSEQLRGVVIGKTGTLNVTDSGVSVLQGVVYTKQHGPILYAVFNMGGDVHRFRKLQDKFLEDALAELRAELIAVRTENIFGEVTAQVAKVTRPKILAKRKTRLRSRA
ncbi:MAG: D-alanyl-D-alanine carboxypeptidase [Acidobacteriota bacterium]|nr:D-alanyl-D-alanine carboxypeptidase [Blastocatellia bacterium]MDW8412284.1 D-alanyl-D-alanine carboxypeptidase [Acidobacteriota bacterium]